MKNITTLLLALQLGLLAGSAQIALPQPIFPLAYQGTLSSNGVAVNGPHDFVLSLHDGAIGGTQLGSSQTNLAVDVTNGQSRWWVDEWQVDELTSPNLHLEVALRPSGSGAPFVTLSPRQRIAHLPLATVAEKAMSISLDALSTSVLGTNGVDGQLLALGSVTGNQIAPEQVVKSLNGLKDGVTFNVAEDFELNTVGNTMTLKFKPNPNCQLYENCYWTLGGNPLYGNGFTTPPLPQTDNPLATDNWLGTKDAKALELRVNTQRGLRLEPDTTLNGGGRTVNFIGGTWNNFVDAGVWSATIGGGGSPNSGANRVRGSYGVVAGGAANVAGGGINNGSYATVSGGFSNLAFGYLSTVAGGARNSATLNFTTVSGGASNVAEAVYATVGGGLRNTNSADGGCIGGGYTNQIQVNADVSTIAGGQSNLIQSGAAFSAIAGGERNRVSDNSHHSAIGGGHNNIIYHNTHFASVGGGELNVVGDNANYASIGGGLQNVVFDNTDDATIGGGRGNYVSATDATIGGGGFNANSGTSSTISGGDGNVISLGADFTTVAGGIHNVASGLQSVIGGGQTNRTTASANAAVVGGGFNNEAGAETSTIGGGVANLTTPSAINATIGGGANNNASAIAAAIGGGIDNANSGISSTIGGGEYNLIPAGADRATVAGGHLNVASGAAATVSGGAFNKAVTPNSTIPGGLQALTGSYGQQAYASGQFAIPGDAQSSLFVLRAGNGQNEMFLDDGTGPQRMNVPPGATWSFNILVVARTAATGAGGIPVGWEIKGVIYWDFSLTPPGVSLLCTNVVELCPSPLQSPLTPSVLAYNASSTHALAINVPAYPLVRWVASVRTVEVINP